MATSIRQLMKDQGVSDLSTYTVIVQKGVGSYPMPGVQRTDTTTALGGNTGVVVVSTDPLLDKRITSAFDMPRVVVFNSGNTAMYIPVALSNQDMRMHLVQLNQSGYLQGGFTYIHIITDLQLEPWKAYQGRITGTTQSNIPP